MVVVRVGLLVPACTWPPCSACTDWPPMAACRPVSIKDW